MSKTLARTLAVLMSLTLVAAACGDDDDGDATTDTTESSGGETEGDEEAAAIDYEAIGLWDDGPCDESLPELKLGLMTTFESPVISLGDSADAFEASAEAFNARGGANGACIAVTACDDGANLDQAVECVRTLDEAGVVASVNDQGTAGQAEVSDGMAAAGIPRIAGNVGSMDWDDQNAYPLDGSGTGVTFLLPQALVNAGVSEIGVIRVDSPGAGALVGFLESVYEGVATFPFDVPVPGGTTDFTQFILGAEEAGVGGVALALGEQEAVQVVRAGQQVSTDLLIGASLGTFSHDATAEFGEVAEQMPFLWSYPPATADLPVYEVLRADLAASGEEALQPGNLKASPMRSWIGMYATLKMLRDAGTTDFTREGMTAMLEAATDVPMLDMFGGENWTPDLDHPGIFQRAGISRWATYDWDPEAAAPDGLEGNWVESSEIDFDEVLCGTPLGAPPETC